MQPMITEKEVKTLVDFLDLQFEGKTMTKQLDKFNPLKKIEVTLNWNGETFYFFHRHTCCIRCVGGKSLLL